MQVGIIGLGRMGANIVRRLQRGGHDCVVYDIDPGAVRALADEGATGAESLDALVAGLARPRTVWMMLPAGAVTESTVTALAERLEPDDAVVDGANSYFKDDLRRAEALAPSGVRYVDVGVSGGVWGLERGYCLMIGGPADVVERLDPLFRALAPGVADVPRTPGREGDPTSAERGYLHCGPVGAGHFVKMVHNGIEYGIMQAYAEGFDLLRGVDRYDVDLDDVAEVWRRGSVIGSWLLDLTAAALAEDADLDAFTGHVEDSGAGRWAVATAVEEGVPAEVLSAALYARFRSRQEHTFAEKVLSAMRRGFGGHGEPGG